MLITLPNPRHFGHAPTGWLKLNNAGVGSRYSTSHSAQCSRLLNRVGGASVPPPKGGLPASPSRNDTLARTPPQNAPGSPAQPSPDPEPPSATLAVSYAASHSTKPHPASQPDPPPTIVDILASQPTPTTPPMKVSRSAPNQK